MTRELADALLEEASYYGEVEIRESYSGRGMFGGTTIAITGELEDITNSFADLLSSTSSDGDEEEMSKLLKLASEFVKLKADSMGTSKIVLY